MKNIPSKQLGASCAFDTRSYGIAGAGAASAGTKVSPIIGSLQMTTELCGQLNAELHDLTKMLVPVLRPEPLTPAGDSNSIPTPVSPSGGEVLDFLERSNEKLRQSLDAITAIKNRLLV
jgi:hypothetical protein